MPTATVELRIEEATLKASRKGRIPRHCLGIPARPLGRKRAASKATWQFPCPRRVYYVWHATPRWMRSAFPRLHRLRWPKPSERNQLALRFRVRSHGTWMASSLGRDVVYDKMASGWWQALRLFDAQAGSHKLSVAFEPTTLERPRLSAVYLSNDPSYRPRASIRAWISQVRLFRATLMPVCLPTGSRAGMARPGHGWRVIDRRMRRAGTLRYKLPAFLLFLGSTMPLYPCPRLCHPCYSGAAIGLVAAWQGPQRSQRGCEPGALSPQAE